MNRDFQDKIDEYVLNRMSIDEIEKFLTEIDDDSSKKEQLKFTQDVQCTISSRENKMKKLEAMRSFYEKEQQTNIVSASPTCIDDKLLQSTSKKKISRKIWWGITGISAISIVCVFLINPFAQEYQKSSIDYIPSFKGNPNEIIRGENSGVFNTTQMNINDSTSSDTICIDTIMNYNK